MPQPPTNTDGKRRCRLGTLTLTFLFLFSFAPLAGFTTFTLKGMLAQLSLIEENIELHGIQDELHHLETKMDTYRQMIEFVADLPAVREILGHAAESPGSIDRRKAATRYTRVLNNSFARNHDVVSIHILDSQGVERFTIRKIAGGSTYSLATSHDSPLLTKEEVAMALAQTGEASMLVPLFPEAPGKEEASRFILRIYTPIVHDWERIGLYVGDIDLGVLARDFPDFSWVTQDGRYLGAAADTPLSYSHFPGLRELFSQGKPAVLSMPEGAIAWVPFLTGKQGQPSLWAGKTINLASVRDARRHLLLQILAGFLLLLVSSLAVSLMLSRYVQQLSVDLLARLEEAIIHRKAVFWTRKSRVQEFSDFTGKMERLLAEYADMEQERRASQKRLAENEELFRTVFNAVQSAVILIDGHDGVRFFNPAAERIFGYEAEEILGKPLHQLVVIPEQIPAAHQGLAAFWRSGKGPIVDRSRELIARRKDGGTFPAEVFVARISKDDEFWAVGAVLDITDRKAKEERLLHLATTDGLTGVNNRRHFMTRARQEQERATRYPEELFLLLFDLDHFKEINDTFGHEAGDQALRRFAAICQERLRSTDILGRVGGEEFAAVLVETNAKEALTVAERIRAAVGQEQIGKEEISRRLSVSIGVSRLGDDTAPGIDSAYRLADMALYEAKRRGRDQVIAAWEMNGPRDETDPGAQGETSAPADKEEQS